MFIMDRESGERAGKQAAQRYIVARHVGTNPGIVRALLDLIPQLKAEQLEFAANGNDHQKGAAAYWIEFCDAFENAIQAVSVQ